MHGEAWRTLIARTVITGACVGVALVALTACAEPRPARIYDASPKITAEQYRDVLLTWTREYKLYDRLDNIIFVTSTYHAPEFRQAFAAAFPDIYGHGGQITRKELLELTDDIERFHTFFLAIFTPDRDWNDLSESDSIWRMTLVGPGDVSVEASEIISVKIDENLRIVYPYLTRFDKAYLVRFPMHDAQSRLVIPPDGKQVTLRIASALGVAEPTWELAPSQNGPPPISEPSSPLPDTTLPRDDFVGPPDPHLTRPEAGGAAGAASTQSTSPTPPSSSGPSGPSGPGGPTGPSGPGAPPP